ncbi:hypothetical protein HanPSC8_Chr13g0562401 [Helianthus annuus]|nr:hypothetical protein HanPSC8_Chr13g0562401 [Helianthus annuus]
MVPINSSTSLQSYSKNTIGFYKFNEFIKWIYIYIYGLTFFYPYHLYLQFIESIPQVHISLYNLYFIWLKVHQVSGDPASVGT